MGQDRPLEAVEETAQPDLLSPGELALIVGDLAYRVDAEIALLAVADDTGEGIVVLAASGAVLGDEPVARFGGRIPRPGPQLRARVHRVA